MHYRKLLGLITTSLLLGACASTASVPKPVFGSFDGSSLPLVATLTCYDHHKEIASINLWKNGARKILTLKMENYTIGRVKEAGKTKELYFNEGRGWRRVPNEELERLFDRDLSRLLDKCHQALDF